jgi:hypothetical protein
MGKDNCSKVTGIKLRTVENKESVSKTEAELEVKA